jgi:class 3 adenylate cyclase
MDTDKLRELLAGGEVPPDQDLEKMRTPVTVLFSDIKGSTAYFEKFGDVQGLAMVQRHNDILFPVIEAAGGRVVKTIGDAIMAVFEDPESGIQGAIGMQRALESDRIIQPGAGQIHIKVGLHTGLGLAKDNDIYGDVVNVASRVQHHAEPDQILVTEDMLEAARATGIQYAKMGREFMRGRIEPIEIYALAWSATSTDQLLEEVQAQFERKLREAKQRQDAVEQEFESARDQWRTERRRLTEEIEHLGETADQAKESARAEVTDDLQSEVRFHLEDAVRGRQQAEQELSASRSRWESERAQLKAQMLMMQNSAIEAMEQSNNPTRAALALREKIDTRLQSARQDWEMQWEGERRRYLAEIERLKKSVGVSEDPRKDAARRALLEKLGKAAGPEAKTAGDWEREFEAARIKWDEERDHLTLRIRKAERELQQSMEDMRSEIHLELRAQYDPQVVTAKREIERLSHELAAAREQAREESKRNTLRIETLEKSIPAAQDSARKQAAAEMKLEIERQTEELNRIRTRNERRFKDEAEEWETERRRMRNQIAKLEDELKDAREFTMRSQRLNAEVGEN